MVDDVVDAYLLTAQQPKQAPGAIYNVGTGVQTTLREVVEIARRALNIAAEPQWGSMPSRLWATDCWVADSRLIRERLGWSPRYIFEAGFAQMLQWFRTNPELLPFYEKHLDSRK